MRRVSLLALLAFACGQDPTVVTPATFERPGAIAFVCVDVANGDIADREDCEGVTGSTDDEMAFVGLVTQTASGEVGAIDFRTRRVIDADWRVPGFTFTRVGEFPSAIAVRPGRDDAEITYVAAYGSRTIEWYPTRQFLNLEGGPEIQGEVHLPGGPTDLVLAPDADVAYAVVPSFGGIVPLSIAADRSLLVNMADAVMPTVPADLPLPVAGTPTEYEFTCAAEGDSVSLGTPEASRVRTEILGEGDTAEPHRLLVVEDGEGGLDELLVADRQLPLIYRFSIGADGTLTELAPLAPGAPIRDLAVSPVVPTDTAGTATTRYLYAIDDTDQSVLVMAFDPANAATFGQVLPVSFGQEFSDRLRLEGKATALDVIVRDYESADATDPDREPAYCETAGDGQGPLNLRGVFLSVGLATGAMQIVDVLDLDGPCRGNQCAEGADEVDQYVYIQRHRPRVANFVVTGIDTLGSPVLTVDGVGRVADSVTGAELIDGLQPVRATGGDPVCPTGQGFVFGELICAAQDPWALRAERWTATYEGTIPGTRQLARMSADPEGYYSFTLRDGQELFCDLGVLGENNQLFVGPDEPEFGNSGDTLVITTEPPEAARDNSLCDEYFDPEGADTFERRFVELPIQQAFNHRLQADPVGAPAEDAFNQCYREFLLGEFVGVEVRLEQAFLVSGARTGFLHRVVPREDDGFCRLDTAGQPVVPGDPSTFINGRAQNGTVIDPDMDPPLTEPAPYQNPYIAFTLDAIPVNEEASLEINLTGTPTSFSIPVGARPGRQPVITIVQDVVYSDVDERLYVLDSNASSLVQYEVAEFQVGNVFE